MTCEVYLLDGDIRLSTYPCVRSDGHASLIQQLNPGITVKDASISGVGKRPKESNLPVGGTMAGRSGDEMM